MNHLRQGEDKTAVLAVARLQKCFIVLVSVAALALFGARSVDAQLPAQLHFYLLGQDLQDASVVWEDDCILLPYGRWVRALPVEIIRADEDGISFKRLDGVEVIWKVNEAKAQAGGKEETLPAPLRIIEGKLHIPLSSLAQLLGARVDVDLKNKLLLFSAVLTSVSLKPVEGGWELSAELSLPVPYRIGQLSNPERLYLDFSGAFIGLPKEKTLERHGLIARVRLGQFSSQPPIARVVLDLDAPAVFEDRTPVKVVSPESRVQSQTPESQLSTLDYHSKVVLFVKDPSAVSHKPSAISHQPEQDAPSVDSMEVSETDGSRATVFVGVKEAFDYKVMRLKDPFRVVLDFQGAQLNLASSSVELPQNLLVKQVRAGQHEGDGGKSRFTRVVIELSRPALYRVYPDRLQSRVVVEIAVLNSLAGRLVVVDPGHGGRQPGARSPWRLFKGRLVEKDLTLDIAMRLKDLLEQAGCSCLMTRTSDVTVSLAERVAFANRSGADVFVSIHLNAWTTPGGRSGTEVYYYTPQSLPLARTIHKHLVALLQRKDNGVRRAMLYVVHHTKMPSVLTEAVYINHPEEEELLRDPQFRQKIAQAIFNGLQEYFAGQSTPPKRRLHQGEE